VTRTLTVQYRRPVPLHTPVRLTAWIYDDTDRLLHIAAHRNDRRPDGECQINGGSDLGVG
jgi:hypothetical protein